MFTESRLHYYIFTEPENIAMFKEQFTKWPQNVVQKFTFEFFNPEFPSSNLIDWKKLYAPCSAQRLFLPVKINLKTIFLVK